MPVYAPNEEDLEDRREYGGAIPTKEVLEEMNVLTAEIGPKLRRLVDLAREYYVDFTINVDGYADLPFASGCGGWNASDM